MSESPAGGKVGSEPPDGDDERPSGTYGTPARDMKPMSMDFLPGLPERYQDLGRVARGGWGEVRRVRDVVLDRVVVVKLLAFEHLDSPRIRDRFLNEATITASLEHPGVVPVHDRGVLDDQRPWFTMREVRGRTLTEILREDTAPAQDVLRLRRMLEVFVRVCDTVEYAHRRGVVHRDLKPSNVMVGELGEVLVVDWGIARRAGERDADADNIVLSPEPATQAGDVLGTAAYMSPEQARGANQLVSERSDVYALGLVLFEILVGRDARPRHKPRAWSDAAGGVVPPLSDADAVPEELRAAYTKAVRVAPAERFADAGELGAAVRAWLDGVARRERADKALATAESLTPTIEGMRAERDALRAEAAQMLGTLDPYAGSDGKVAAWRLEDAAAELEQRIAVAETERLAALAAVLEHEAENADAHARLAAIYRARMLESEARGARSEVASFELLLRRHDRGENARFLAGNGRLELDTAPTGQRAEIRRVVLRDRRLVEDEWSLTVTTPFAVELPAGSYVVHFGTTRYPVLIERDATWPTTRPGDAGPTPIELVEGLGEDDVYVPAGFSHVGGDHLALEPVAAARVWIDGFVIKRFQVTCEEYLAFMDEIHHRDPALPIRYAPRFPKGAVETEPIMVRRENDRWSLLPDVYGRSPIPTMPIAMVDYASATAYADWLSERDGLPWRLPNELELEKAARGTDRRSFPWGDQAEPTWACVGGGTAETPVRVPVDTFPIDVSPYAVRGLAGNVRVWCGNVWTAEGPTGPADVLVHQPADAADGSLRSIRGGAHAMIVAGSRGASRFAMRPADRFAAVGVRIVRPLR